MGARKCRYGRLVARLTCLLALGLATAVPDSAIANFTQIEARSIGPRAACSQCRIDSKLLLSFVVPGGICPSARVAWTGAHYAVAPGCDRRQVEIRLFDERGVGVGTLGGAGQGPGERERVLMIASRGDGLLYVHALTKVQVYRGLSLVREFRPVPMAVPHWMAPLDDGSFIVSGTNPTPEFAGRGLLVYDSAGGLVSATGTNSSWLLREDPKSWQAIETAPSGGIVWTSYQMGQARLELHDIQSGDLLRAFARAGSVFDEFPWDDNRSALTAGMTVSGGRLWVAVLAASAQYRDDESLFARAANRVHHRRDTVIDIVDPENGTLWATQRMDDALLGFLPAAEPTAWTVREDPADPLADARIEIYRLRLIGDERAGRVP